MRSFRSPGLFAVCLIALALASPASRAGVGGDPADLGLTVEVDPASPILGQPLTYTLTINNAGPNTTRGIVVSDVIKGAKATITSADASQGSGCTISASKLRVRCVLGAIGNGGSADITVVVDAGASGNLVNTGLVTSRAPDPSQPNQQVQLTTRVIETDAPSAVAIGGSAFQQPFQTRRSFVVAWTATDIGSGLAGFDVRYRAAAPTLPFAHVVRLFQGTSLRRAIFTGKPGWSYCFSVRATDQDGNVSAWSPERCTAVMLGPARVIRTGNWQFKRGDVGSSTSLRSTTGGAVIRLPGLRARGIYLVAVVCPNCGRVEVLWSGRLLKNVNLTSPRRQKRVVSLVTFPSAAFGTLILKVASSHGAVTIYGFGITRR